MRRTNDDLATVLGPNDELVQALANRDNFQPLPFVVAPQPVKPDYAPEVVRDSRPLQSAEPGVETFEEEERTADSELPSAETFGEEEESQDAATEPVATELDGGSQVKEPNSEEERLREERIQQLLDLLAKAESLAEQNVPELPPAPIIERAVEPVQERVEPLVIPQPPQAPKEIVLRATATMPYQSVRSERVELLNVQQMAPTIPARPGVPAVVANPGLPAVNAPGWANQDWSKGLVPDFSALGTAAPDEIGFAPLPQESPTVEPKTVSGTETNVGKVTPELDANPATAARPIQKNQERR